MTPNRDRYAAPRLVAPTADARRRPAAPVVALPGAEEQFRALAEIIPFPLAIIGRADGRIERVNAAMVALFGAQAARLEGSAARAFFARPRDWRHHFVTVNRAGTIKYFETKLKRADGSLLDVAINSVTVEVGGRPLIASFIINLTHQKKVESALREAKEEAEIGSASKSEFLANMSHELRTPLNAIIGFTDIILRELFGPMGNQRYVDYLRDIEGSAQHLLQVIGDILDMAKIEAGQAELQEELVELRPVLSSCLRLVAERAHRGGVTLKEETAVDLPLLVADQRKLKQILLNLLSNAVKFTPKDGEVILAAAVNGDGRLELSVIDTGIGMSESDIVTALKPFGQVEGSLARKFEGSGLGLPITKALVEMHGGQMRIASTPGTGTTVWVVLPAKRLLDSASLAR